MWLRCQIFRWVFAASKIVGAASTAAVEASEKTRRFFQVEFLKWIAVWIFRYFGSRKKKLVFLYDIFDILSDILLESAVYTQYLFLYQDVEKFIRLRSRTWLNNRHQPAKNCLALMVATTQEWGVLDGLLSRDWIWKRTIFLESLRVFHGFSTPKNMQNPKKRKFAPRNKIQAPKWEMFLIGVQTWTKMGYYCADWGFLALCETPSSFLNKSLPSSFCQIFFIKVWIPIWIRSTTLPTTPIPTWTRTTAAIHSTSGSSVFVQH